MKSKPDGGNAFPIPANMPHHPTYPGMSLRDYFAAKAMQGILSDHEIDHMPDKLAELAYRAADAMLEARK